MAREIKQKLYRVSFYGVNNRHFVECESLDDLYDYVAHKVVLGDICVGVSEVCKDGSMPKVPVLSTKEYKKLIREYQDKQKRGEVI